MRSLSALRGYFVRIAALGAEGAPFEALQHCGIDAEARMFGQSTRFAPHEPGRIAKSLPNGVATHFHRGVGTGGNRGRAGSEFAGRCEPPDEQPEDEHACQRADFRGRHPSRNQSSKEIILARRLSAGNARSGGRATAPPLLHPLNCLTCVPPAWAPLVSRHW